MGSSLTPQDFQAPSHSLKYPDFKLQPGTEESTHPLPGESTELKINHTAQEILLFLKQPHEPGAVTEKEWSIILGKNISSIHELCLGIVEGEEAESSQTLDHLLDEIASTLEELQAKSPSNTKETQEARETREKIASARKEVETTKHWLTIQKNYHHYSANLEDLVIKWNEEWVVPQENRTDSSLAFPIKNYVTILEKASALLLIYQEIKASQLPAELQQALCKNIQADLSLISTVQGDSPPSSWLDNQLKVTCEELKQAQAALAEKHTQMPALLEAYRHFQEAQSKVNYLEDRLQAALKKMINLKAGLQEPYGKTKTSHNTPEDDELLKKYAAIMEQVESTRQALQQSADKVTTDTSESQKADKNFLEQFKQFNDPQGNKLMLLLKKPFTELAGKSLTRQDPAEFLQAKRQLAFILGIESMLPIEVTPQLKQNVTYAREMAVSSLELGDAEKENISSAKHLYTEILREEGKVKKARYLSYWHKHEIELLAKLEEATPAWKVQALHLFFLALHAGSWVNAASAMYSNTTAMQHAKVKWDAELKSMLDHKVEKSTAFLGTVLSDKFDAIHNMTEQELKNFTHRFAGTFEILQPYRSENATKPSQTEQSAILDAFRLSHLPQQVGPYAHLSTNEWLKKFQNSTEEAVTEGSFEMKPVSLSVENVSELALSSTSPQTETTPLILSASRTQTFWTGWAKNIQEWATEALWGTPEALPVKESAPSPSKAPKQPDPLPTLTLRNLLDTPPIDIDERTLLHVVGDIFGEGSQLEGSTSSVMLTYFQNILKAKIDVLKQQGHCDDEAKLEFCRDLFGSDPIPDKAARDANLAFFEDLAVKIDTASVLHEALTDSPAAAFRDKLRAEVERISAGETFFFPGRWKGHGIVYEILKQADGKLSFRVYNTGQGIETYYKRAVIQTETQYFPFVEIVDIAPDNFLNLAVLRSLQELAIHEGKVGTVLGPRDLYERIIEEMGGKASEATHELQEVRSPQQSGTCSYMSLLAAFSQQFSDQSKTNHFDFETKLKALSDYDALHHHTYATKELNRKLMQKGTAAFAVELERWNSENVVSLKEMELALDKLHHIQTHLQNAEIEYAAQVAANYPQLSIQDQPLATYHNGRDITVGWPDSTKVKPLSAQPYAPAILLNWQPEAPKLVEDASALLERAIKSRESGNWVDAQEGIKQFVLNIPLNEAGFWDQVDLKQAGTLIDLFSKLSREFFLNYIAIGPGDPNREVQLKPAEYLSIIKLLAFADKVARLSQILQVDIPGLYQQNFGLFLENRSMNFALPEAKWAQVSEEIKEYWKQQQAQGIVQNFFDFEHRPTSAGETSWSNLKNDLNGYLEIPPNRRPPELDWAIKFISQPHISRQIREQYPEIAARNIIMQAIDMLSPQREVFTPPFNPTEEIRIMFPPPKIIPSAFFALTELSFYADFVLTGGFEAIKYLNSKGEFTMPSHFSGVEWEKGISFTRNIFDIKNWFSDHPEEPAFRSENANHHNARYVWSECHLNHTAQGLRDETLSDLFQIRDPSKSYSVYTGKSYYSDYKDSFEYYSQDISRLPEEQQRLLAIKKRRQITPNQVAITTPDQLDLSASAAQGLSLQKARQLLGLNSNPQTQVQETLGYFIKQPHHLSYIGYRDAFKILMFDAGLLLKQMQTPSQSAGFANQLAEFCQQNYLRSQQNEDLPAQLFFLEINRSFADYIVWHQAKAPDCFPSNYRVPFFDSRQMIKTLLAQTDVPRDIQHSLYRTQVGYYQSKPALNSEDAADFLISAIRLSLFNPNEIVIERVADIESRDALHNRHAELYQLLAGSEQVSLWNQALDSLSVDPERQIRLAQRNLILNTVLHAFYPHESLQVWNMEHFPLFTSASGAFSIDALKGNMYENNAVLTQLPLSITGHKTFLDFFGAQKILDAKQIEKGRFEFTDNYGNNYRIQHTFLKGINQIIIQRQFGHDWYQQADSSVLKIDPSVIYQNADVWIAATQKEAFITAKNTYTPLYRVSAKISLEAQEPRIIVHQLDAQAQDTDLVVANLRDRQTTLESLKRFEDPSHIVILQHHLTGEIRSIKWPRYDVTFNIDRDPSTGKNRASSESLDGFSLAESQGVEALGDLDNYLVLEKRLPDGQVQRRVILSTNPFEDNPFFVEYRSSLVTDTTKKTNPLTRSAPLICDVNSNTGRLEPRSEAARFMLAKNYLWKHDYVRAQEYLHGFGSQLQPLSPHERSILKDIAFLKVADNDPHPKAAAIRLKALTLLYRDEEDFSYPSLLDNGLPKPNPLENEFARLLYEDYRDYVEDLEYQGEFKLSVEEEVLLLKRLDAMYQFLHVKLVEHIQDKTTPLPLQYDEMQYNQEVIANRMVELEIQSYGMLGVLPKLRARLRGNLPLAAFDRKMDSKHWHLALFNYQKKPPQVEAGGAILQDNLLNGFLDYYKALRNESPKTPDVLVGLIVEIGGMHAEELKGLSLEELTKTLDTLLSLKTKSEQPVESMTALVLKMLMQHPEKFPEAYEVSNLEGSYPQSSAYGIDYHERTISHFMSAALELYLALPPPQPLWPENLLYASIAADPSKARSPEEIEGMCLRLLDHPFEAKAVVQDLGRYLTIQPPTPEQLAAHAQATEELVEALSIPLTDQVAVREFERVKHQVETTNKGEEAIRHNYTVNDMSALNRLKLDSLQSVELGQLSLMAQRQSIEAQVNRPFEDRALQAAREIRLVAHPEEHIDLDEAIMLFLHTDTADFRRRNPALSDKEAIVLAKDIQAYLKMETYHQHLKRLATAIDQLEKKTNAMEPAEDIQEAIQEVGEIATAYRAYDTGQHPEYLVFEYYMGIILRKDQVLNIDKLQIRNGKIETPQHMGAVLEMIMGAGKTSVISPLLSLLNADGKQLAMSILPTALMASMVLEQQKTSGKSFKQVVELLEFNRAQFLNAGKLHRIYERLCRIRDERKVLFIDNSSVQSLYLKFVEKLDLYVDYLQKKETSTGTTSSTNDPLQISMERELILFRAIFQIFKDSGNVMIDEVDTVLDVLKSFHFTVGEPKALEAVYSDTVPDLFLFLTTNPAIQQGIQLGFAKSKSPHPFTETQYNEVIKPLLAQAVLEGQLGGQNKELGTFLAKLKADEREQVSDFLTNGPLAVKGYELIDERADSRTQDMLAIYSEQFNELLPLTAPKNINEHYGKDPTQPHSHLAIPCQKSKPSVGSQFGTDPETLNYSTQMHLVLGIPQDIVDKEIERLKALISTERNQYPKKLVKSLDSYQLFLRLTGGEKGYSINKLSPKDLHAITKSINENLEVQIELITRYVIPEIKVYETQLNADGQLFGLLFMIKYGMTGTLWNADTLPKIMQLAFASDTTSKTLKLLWKNSPKRVDTITVPAFQEGNQQAAIKQLLMQIYHAKAPKGSYIDTSGFFSGVSDRANVAKEMLQMPCWQGTPIKGVVYYDTNDKLMVMTATGAVELTKCSLSKEEMVTFWDQEHTTGSDIKLGARMTAAVSLGRHNLERDLEQSAWRLRGLGKGQRVHFIISDDDRQVIESTLQQKMGITVTGELEFKHLLLYVIYNQSQRQGNDNYRSFKQKMQALLLEKVWGVILDPEVTFEALVDIYSGCRELFATTLTERPFVLYGRKKISSVREKVVQSDVDNFLKSKAMQTFRTHPLLKAKFNSETLENEVRDLAKDELPKLPNELMHSGGYGKERTIQTERKKEKQTDTQTEIEMAKSTQVYPHPSYLPRQPILWDSKNLFTQNYFAPSQLSEVAFASYPEVAKDDRRPILKIEDVLKATPHLAKHGSAFDSELLCTLNLCPGHNPNPGEHPYTPLGFYQKEVNYALAIEDKATGQLKLMLLDKNDAAPFKGMLVDDWMHPENQAKREVGLTLYHFDSKTYEHGLEGISPERLESDTKLSDQFLRLKVQAKFFRGDSDFNEQELVPLEKWLVQGNARELCDLYTQQILLWKDESRVQYQDSTLHKLFIKLGVAE